MKVAFCVPSLHGPMPPFIASLEASLPLLDEAGIEHCAVEERGCPYISAARATMLRKALDAKADVVVFIDYDMSWDPVDLLKLIQAEGDVVSGAYRFKCDDETYMGRLLTDDKGHPIVRHDGCVKAEWIPAGFLKITAGAVNHFMGAYPELVYGPRYSPLIDLFNHGAFEGLWWGEDYAFSRRWQASGGEIWVIPDLNLTHNTTGAAYPGNYHQFLLRQPGGSEAPAAPQAPEPKRPGSLKPKVGEAWHCDMFSIGRSAA